jgi:outer membrane protein assembly factor BamB
MDEPLVVLEQNRILALDAATGAVRWATPIAGCNPIFARMVITEGVVIVAAFDALSCCDHQTGKLLWRASTRKGARGGIVARGGRVFLYKNGAIDCYDGRGNLLWQHESESQYGGSLGFTGDVCWVPNDRQ